MSDHLFPFGRQAFLNGAVNVISDTIKLVLTDSTYTQSDGDQYLTAIATPVATSPAFAGKASTAGTFSATPITLPAVPGGHTVTGVAVFKDTGSAATSPLLAWMDHDNMGGVIGMVTTGIDVVVSFPGGAVFTI